MRVTQYVIDSAQIKQGPGSARLIRAVAAYVDGVAPVPLKFVLQDERGELHTVTAILDGMIGGRTKQVTLPTGKRQLDGFSLALKLGADHVDAEYYLSDSDNERGWFTDRT